MKKLLIMFILSFSSLAGYCPEYRTLIIAPGTKIDPYQRIFRAVCMVESSGNPKALNKIEQAYGIVQIRAIRLDDYKKRTGKGYQLKEMYDTTKSKEVFYWYAKKIGFRNEKQIICKWNGSGKKTIEYYNKVKKYL